MELEGSLLHSQVLLANDT